MIAGRASGRHLCGVVLGVITLSILLSTNLSAGDKTHQIAISSSHETYLVGERIVFDAKVTLGEPVIDLQVKGFYPDPEHEVALTATGDLAYHYEALAAAPEGARKLRITLYGRKKPNGPITPITHADKQVFVREPTPDLTDNRIKLTALSDAPDPFSAVVKGQNTITSAYQVQTDVTATYVIRQHVRIKNARGDVLRDIETVLELPAGATAAEVTAHWDGKNGAGQMLPDGVYAYEASGILYSHKVTPGNVIEQIVGVTSTQQGGIALDNTPPVLSATQAPEPNAAGWNNTDVKVTFSAEDNLSGVAEVTQPVTVTEEGKDTGVQGRALDKAGNEAALTYKVNIDKTAPTTAHDYAKDGVWSNLDADIKLTATDALSGVDKTFYSINGSEPVEGTRVQITEAGAHTVSYYSIDNAGIEETRKTISVKIDKTSPIVNNLSPSRDAVTRDRRQVISFRAADAFALDPASLRLLVGGVDVTAQCERTNGTLSYTPADNLPEGTVALEASASDMAGNRTTCEWSFVTDYTPPHPPTVNFPAGMDHFETTEEAIEVTGDNSEDTVEVRVRCDTATVGPVVLGTWKVTISNMDINQHTCYATALDKVGNESAATEFSIIRFVPGGPLSVTITNPPSGSSLPDEPITISGLVSRDAEVVVTDALGGEHEAVVTPPAEPGMDYEWTASGVKLKRGNNVVQVKATADGDEAMVSAAYFLEVFLLSEEPGVIRDGDTVSGSATGYFYIREWPEVQSINVKTETSTLGEAVLAETNFFLWDTREIENNSPKFPNGTYEIALTVSFGPDEVYTKIISVAVDNDWDPPELDISVTDIGGEDEHGNKTIGIYDIEFKSRQGEGIVYLPSGQMWIEGLGSQPVVPYLSSTSTKSTVQFHSDGPYMVRGQVHDTYGIGKVCTKEFSLDYDWYFDKLVPTPYWQKYVGPFVALHDTTVNFWEPFRIVYQGELPCRGRQGYWVCDGDGSPCITGVVPDDPEKGSFRCARRPYAIWRNDYNPPQWQYFDGSMSEGSYGSPQMWLFRNGERYNIYPHELGDPGGIYFVSASIPAFSGSMAYILYPRDGEWITSLRRYYQAYLYVYDIYNATKYNNPPYVLPWGPPTWVFDGTEVSTGPWPQNPTFNPCQLGLGPHTVQISHQGATDSATFTIVNHILQARLAGDEEFTPVEEMTFYRGVPYEFQLLIDDGSGQLKHPESPEWSVEKTVRTRLDSGGEIPIFSDPESAGCRVLGWNGQDQAGNPTPLPHTFDEAGPRFVSYSYRHGNQTLSGGKTINVQTFALDGIAGAGSEEKVYLKLPTGHGRVDVALWQESGAGCPVYSRFLSNVSVGQPQTEPADGLAWYAAGWDLMDDLGSTKFSYNYAFRYVAGAAPGTWGPPSVSPDCYSIYLDDDDQASLTHGDAVGDQIMVLIDANGHPTASAVQLYAYGVDAARGSWSIPENGDPKNLIQVLQVVQGSALVRLNANATLNPGDTATVRFVYQEEENPTVTRSVSLQANRTHVELYRPDTTTDQHWQSDTYKLRWEQVIFRGQAVKAKVKLEAPISDISDFTIPLEIATFADPVDGRTWKRVTIDENDRLGSGGKEILITVNAQEVVEELALLPAQAEDGVNEFTTADYVAPLSQGSNHNDGDAFDTYMLGAGWKRRGKARDDGNINAKPPECSVNKDFVSAGGVLLLEGRAGGAVTEMRPIQDQADVFYISGHGQHDTGQLLVSSAVRAEDVRWKEDLDVVAIAGCAILDINDYNNNYQGAAHTKSPGKQWAKTGPRFLLGYNWVAPLDDNKGDPQFTKKIVDAYNNSQLVNPANRWLWANRQVAEAVGNKDRTVPEGRPWNACAIEITDQGAVYWFWDFNTLDQWGFPTVRRSNEDQW